MIEDADICENREHASTLLLLLLDDNDNDDDDVDVDKLDTFEIAEKQTTPEQHHHSLASARKK